MSNERKLNINVDEAILIDNVLKYNDDDFIDLDEWKDALLQLGYIICNKNSYNILLNEEQLWELRGRILASHKCGSTFGFSLLQKIYKLLLDIDADNVIEEVEYLNILNEKTSKEETKAGKSTS